MENFPGEYICESNIRQHPKPIKYYSQSTGIPKICDVLTPQLSVIQECGSLLCLSQTVAEAGT